MRHNLKKHAGWIILIVVLLGLTPIASSLPDGLERVAIDLGFMNQEQTLWEGGPMIGYSIRALGDSKISTLLAGTAGCAVILIAFFGIRGKRSNERKAN
ncbi:hypothetical protein FHR92_004486 [Fontibacillus solani]|uniref:PDGLE domain-containing protein n=1 Tax=Fontibacillus solani TaxID=1572857 RepID=A0A7W3XTU3_9BACL|nr:PDGLE domain-containing protein [Fontibacillus solani]MBA9087993.1 hypothetical protein [Fontibacillus solani]